MSIIETAISHLSDCSCSERELRRFLEKEFAERPNLDSSIDSAFKHLKKFHLINDARLAMNLAEHYIHKGNRFITHLLTQRGVDEEVITKVLSSLENEHSRALDEARKKIGGHWDSSERTMTLLHRFLSGRSFSHTAIKSAIGQLDNQRKLLKNCQPSGC